MSLVVICMPPTFLFESTKFVPWRYDVTAIVNGQEERIEEKLKDATKLMSLTL